MQIRDVTPMSFGEKCGRPDLLGPRPIAELRSQMNRLFDDYFERSAREHRARGGPVPAPTPASDVAETDAGLEVSVELPGVARSDVEVSASGGVLKIRGEKRIERAEEKSRHFRAERAYGAFARSIPLPAGFDAEKAEATLRDGVLTVTVPPPDDGGSGMKTIEIRTG